MLLFFLFCFFPLLILVFILFFLIVFCPRCSCSYSLSSSPTPHIYSFTLSSNLNIIYITTIKFPSLLLYLLSVIIELNSPLTHSVSGFFFAESSISGWIWSLVSGKSGARETPHSPGDLARSRCRELLPRGQPSPYRLTTPPKQSLFSLETSHLTRREGV